jgi:hypothetical protein
VNVRQDPELVLEARSHTNRACLGILMPWGKVTHVWSVDTSESAFFGAGLDKGSDLLRGVEWADFAAPRESGTR